MLPFTDITFAYPWVLLLLVLLLPMFANHYRRFRHRQRVVVFSGTQGFQNLPKSAARLGPHVLFTLQVVAVACLVAAAARPQYGNSVVERKSEGLDIVLVVDTSGSMRALDLKLNGTRYDRLTVVKNVLLEFIKKRLSDRIGMVVFGSEAFTQAPLTLDHDVLVDFLGQLEIEMAGPRTAIGDALATASRRLKDIASKSKIIILLTDGENTAGTVEPLVAAEAAQTLGIKIYTIGVGSDGSAPFPVQGFFGQSTRMMEVRLDAELLAAIAAKTGGKAFLANDTDALRQVYDTIDQLEKTEIEVTEFTNYEEAAAGFLWAALAAILLGAVLGTTRWRSLP